MALVIILDRLSKNIRQFFIQIVAHRGAGIDQLNQHEDVSRIIKYLKTRAIIALNSASISAPIKMFSEAVQTTQLAVAERPGTAVSAMFASQQSIFRELHRLPA
jgi:hypothetical protein